MRKRIPRCLRQSLLFGWLDQRKDWIVRITISWSKSAIVTAWSSYYVIKKLWKLIWYPNEIYTKRINWIKFLQLGQSIKYSRENGLIQSKKHIFIPLFFALKYLILVLIWLAEQNLFYFIRELESQISWCGICAVIQDDDILQSKETIVN